MRCQTGTMSTEQCDLIIRYKRRLDGRPYAVVRICTPGDIVWHTVSLPEGADVFALHHQIVTDALRRIQRAGGVISATLQEVLPIGRGHE